ncbi:MAG TPA: DUF2147 domain-containing protein [Ramlibacter sp.]|jgi:uncharacterized protein (DUF2147 family)
MRRALIALAALAATAAYAQQTPVGLWRNVDDKTGEVKAEIRITDNNGALSGRIEKILKKDAKPDDVCDKCEDDRKNQPMKGLEIIRGGKPSPDGDVWEGGKILDPENGSEYRMRLKPIDGGKKLQVRGYLGPFYRTQTWVRAGQEARQ